MKKVAKVAYVLFFLAAAVVVGIEYISNLDYNRQIDSPETFEIGFPEGAELTDFDVSLDGEPILEENAELVEPEAFRLMGNSETDVTIWITQETQKFTVYLQAEVKGKPVLSQKEYAVNKNGMWDYEITDIRFADEKLVVEYQAEFDYVFAVVTAFFFTFVGTLLALIFAVLLFA